ncbi:MAG: hypothetical protein IPM36_24000 [Lewinellaceae bacterium]|nr:hypothetical protein [Lewinellaceae bacterium]
MPPASTNITADAGCPSPAAPPTDLQIETGDYRQPMSGVQRALFLDTQEEYLCVTVLKPGCPTVDRNLQGVTLGICWTIGPGNYPFLGRSGHPTHPGKCNLRTLCAAGLYRRDRASHCLQKREARRRMTKAIRKLTE